MLSTFLHEGKCLVKITSEKVPRIILVTSFWKSQAWFPLILRISVEIPLLLQSHKKILADPLGNSYPMGLQGHLQQQMHTVTEQDQVMQVKIKLFYKLHTNMVYKWLDNKVYLI